MQKDFCKDVVIERCLARRELCVCDVTLRHPLFKNVPRAETHKLNHFSVIQKYNNQQNVFFDNMQPNYVYFVLKGKVKLYSCEAESQGADKEFTHRICRAGDSINAETLLGTQDQFRYSVRAIEESLILEIQKQSLLEFMQRNPVVIYNLATFLSDAIINAEKRSRSFILEEVSERLLGFIDDECAKRKTNQIDLDLSKAELAQYPGTLPATLSRAFVKLEEAGLISMTKNKILRLPQAIPCAS